LVVGQLPLLSFCLLTVNKLPLLSFCLLTVNKSARQIFKLFPFVLLISLHHTVEYSCAISLYSSSPHQEVKIWNEITLMIYSTSKILSAVLIHEKGRKKK
jgi:hypothetical protein